MKQEVEFKVDLENRKSIQTNIVYTDDMINKILESKIKLISFTRNDKVVVIGKLKKIKLVFKCDNIIKFKGILISDFDIDLNGLELKLSFLHRKNSDTIVRPENVWSIDLYLVDSMLESVLKNIDVMKFSIVDKFNRDKTITNAKVLFEDLHEHLKNRNEKFKNEDQQL